jgi:hypothetical protein
MGLFSLYSLLFGVIRSKHSLLFGRSIIEVISVKTDQHKGIIQHEEGVEQKQRSVRS